MLRWFVALAFTVVAGVGAVILLTQYDELTATLPTIDRLLEYDPPVATRVYAADGSLIEEFFRERRYRVPISEIPPLVRNAFLAAEDSDFFAHRGVDFIGILRAAIVNFRAGDVVQGASTITQQVVKALLLTPERSYERKLKEILLSLRLEQHLSKEQILELYLNQIYFGDGNHGVGAAARNYFGKSVQELTAAEAALLAGLPAAPSRYSPARDPAAATKRQHYVLRRMLEEHFLGAGEYQAALRAPIHLLARHQKPSSVRNYYTETVRLQLETMFGAEAPYNQGYTVHTAMDPRLQNLAETAVRNNVERLDVALGYRGPLAHASEAESADRIAAVTADLAGGPPDPERIYQGVVTRVAGSKLDVTVGPYRTTVDASQVRWSYKVRTRAFKAGDVVEVRTREAGKSGAGPAAAEAKDAGKAVAAQAADKAAEAAPAAPRFFLAQTPEIEAALIAIDIDKGGIAALVGGYDFLASQFNRALQAKRQPGSAFKPFVYSAALDHGFTPASVLQDTPVEYMDNDKVWAPRNYTRDYKGPMRLRTALEQSRNVVSVKIVDQVGVKTVVDYLQRFHLNAEFGANLSLALGTSEMTLRDLTEGYTAFANNGVKVEPVIIRSIEDKDGRAFFTDEPRRREALSPETAALMTYILRGVVERGTGTSVKALERPVAGKTGTTNEQRDAWFIGYTPNLAVGVWVGFDDPNQTMGKMGTGGRVAAPIWLDFMKPALAGTPVRDFEIPEDISCVNIDPDSGRRAAEWTDAPFLECFKEGTEPGGASERAGDDVAIRDDSAPADSPRADADRRAGTDRIYGSEDEEGGVDPYDPEAMRPERPFAGGDPRWPSERDPESAPPDRWTAGPRMIPPPPAPYVPPGAVPGYGAPREYAPPYPSRPIGPQDAPGEAAPPRYPSPYSAPSYPSPGYSAPGYSAPGDARPGYAPAPYGAPGAQPGSATDPRARPEVEDKLRARAVPSEHGAEVRLYRDSELAERERGGVKLNSVPSPKRGTDRDERLWATAPIEPDEAPAHDTPDVRLFPNTAPATAE